jgi:hypothetical protein
VNVGTTPCINVTAVTGKGEMPIDVSKCMKRVHICVTTNFSGFVFNGRGDFRSVIE